MLKFPSMLVAMSLLAGTAVVAKAADNSGLNIPSLEPSAQEVDKALSEVENAYPQKGMTFDSIKVPGDRIAYKAAMDAFNQRFQWSIYELGKMKTEAIEYSIVANRPGLSEKHVAEITAAYSKQLQSHYNNAVWSIAASYNDEDAVLKKCITSACVTDIHIAFEEMRSFKDRINKNLNFKNMSSKRELFWKFQSPLLTASFSKTFHQLVPNNKDHNAFKTVAAGLYASTSVAAVTTVDALRAAGSAIFNPRYRNIRLTVDKVQTWDRKNKVEDAMSDTFKTNIEQTAEGSRVPTEPIPVDPAPAPAPAPAAEQPKAPGVADGGNLDDLMSLTCRSLKDRLENEQTQFLASVRNGDQYKTLVGAEKTAYDTLTQRYSSVLQAYSKAYSDNPSLSADEKDKADRNVQFLLRDLGFRFVTSDPKEVSAVSSGTAQYLRVSGGVVKLYVCDDYYNGYYTSYSRHNLCISKQISPQYQDLDLTDDDLVRINGRNAQTAQVYAQYNLSDDCKALLAAKPKAPEAAKVEGAADAKAVEQAATDAKAAGAKAPAAGMISGS